jgi:hypothetical protein
MDIKMIYLFYQPSDYNIFSYETLLNYTELTHLWLFCGIDKNYMIKDKTFYSFISKLNLLDNLNTLFLIGYIVEDFEMIKKNYETKISHVLLNNLPIGLENLYFEINYPASNIDEISFNCPITLKNLEISLSRCWENEYEQHKNRINVSKLPFGTNVKFHLNTDISLIKDPTRI